MVAIVPPSIADFHLMLLVESKSGAYLYSNVNPKIMDTIGIRYLKICAKYGIRIFMYCSIKFKINPPNAINTNVTINNKSSTTVNKMLFNCVFKNPFSLLTSNALFMAVMSDFKALELDHNATNNEIESTDDDLLFIIVLTNVIKIFLVSSGRTSIDLKIKSILLAATISTIFNKTIRNGTKLIIKW